jgi:putative transcriptional regulator
VEALLAIDEDNGGQKIHAYEGMLFSDTVSRAVYATYEYTYPMQLAKLATLIDADFVNKGTEKPLYGFTVVDSRKAIVELSSHEFQKLYGWSTERAMVFTRVSTGKSPMVAIRVTTLKPAAVVLHGISTKSVDPMAKKMAEVDRIPLLATTKDLDEIVDVLKKYSQYHVME